MWLKFIFLKDLNTRGVMLFNVALISGTDGETDTNLLTKTCINAGAT